MCTTSYRTLVTYEMHKANSVSFTQTHLREEQSSYLRSRLENGMRFWVINHL